MVVPCFLLYVIKRHVFWGEGGMAHSLNSHMEMHGTAKVD